MGDVDGLEVGISGQTVCISGREIVDDDNLEVLRTQRIDEMASDETSSSRYYHRLRHDRSILAEAKK
jgi:hypothetical protein